MKARIKATGEIVEVVLNGFYYESIKDEMIFEKSELEIMPKTKDPDYWTRLKHKYAGMAMQGILAHEGTEFRNYIPQEAMDIAHALVEKLKEKEERK